MMHKSIIAMMVFMAVIMPPMVAGEWVAGSLVYGDVVDQFGEEELEGACNGLGVEWTFAGVNKIDGERVDPGLFDILDLAGREGPVAQENVTIVCHLNQGFLTSTQETMVVNASGV